MTEFDQLVRTAYRNLLDIGTFIDDKEKFFAFMFERLPETVVDKESLRQIQVDDLFKAMNHTRTITGAATLYRSLIQPLTSLDLILAKQEALRELESNDKLRNAIIDFLEELKLEKVKKMDRRFFNRFFVRNGEEILYDFLNYRLNPAPFEPLYTYFKTVMKTGAKLADAAKQIPRPESMYLETLISTLQGFGETGIYRLMRGPIYRTFEGLKSKEDINFFTPRWKFLPKYSSIPSLGVIVLPTGFVIVTKTTQTESPSPEMIQVLLFSSYAPIVGLAYIGLMKLSLDYNTVIAPLTRQVIADPEFKLTLDSLGKLDELVSLYDYAKAMPTTMVLPEMHYSVSHFLRSRDIKNPILGKSNPNYVPNDIELYDGSLTFVTGPNSGGKTTLAKTIAQIQLMAQIGSYVPADEAKMSVADRIFYQFYLPDKLQNREGDFGINLSRTMDIFYATTPQSLVIFNTLASGTTTHEGIEQAYGILRDFLPIGNTTIYVTHQYEVAEMFARDKIGQFLRTHFIDEKPTYKFVHGISRESHAAKIAEKIGFSPADRKRHLIERGYI